MKFCIITILALLTCLSFTLTACDSPEKKAENYMKRGDEFFKTKDYDHARLEYLNAVQQQPANAKAFFKLGITYEAQGNFPKAFSNFLTAEQQNTSHDRALTKIAEYFIISKRYDESSLRINKLLKLNPKHSQAYALRALMALRLKDIDKAEKSAKISLQYNSGNITAHATLAHIYGLRGDLTKALAITSKGIARNPEDISLLLLKVSFLDQLNDELGITQTYQQIFDLAPQVITFRKDLVQHQIKKDKLDEAEKTLRDAVAQIKDNEIIKKDLIFFLNKYYNFTKAKDEITSLVAAGLKEETGLFWLAQIHMIHEQPKQSIEILKKLANNDIFEGIPLFSREILAQIYYEREDILSTKKWVREILQHKADNVEALFLKASIMADSKDIENAALTLNIILRDTPTHSKSLYKMAHLMMLQKRFDIAMDSANKLLDINKNINALFLKADIFTAMGHAEDAIALYKTLHEKAPEEEDIANNYAFLLAEYKSDDKQALTLALSIVQKFESSDNIHLLDTLAWVYFRLGEFDKAAHLMNKIMQSKEHISAELYYHYGAILAATGDKVGAKKALTRATQGKKGYSGLEHAKNKLKSLSN